MQDLSKYPVIQFADKSSNFNKKRKGIQINEYLVIAYCDVLEKQGSPIKIYKICTGLPLINVTFSTIPDAVKIAEWFSETFGEYFPIWDKYPEADIFSMVKWTIPDGIRAYETVRLFAENDKATPNELAQAYVKAQGYIKEWTNDHS